MARLDQENDPEILRKAVLLLQSHNQVLSKKLAEALRELARAQDELGRLKGEPIAGQLRIEALEQQIAKLTKQLFGTSSEKCGAGEEPTTSSGEGEEPKAPGGEEPKKDKDKKPQRGHGP